MIAVATFRPHRDSEEYGQNQTRALNSWEPIFSEIILMGEHEPDLAMRNVVFTNQTGRPRIKDMVSWLSVQDQIGVWLNADIFLDRSFVLLEALMKKAGCLAATSFRYTFDPHCHEISIKESAVRERNDWGLDVFACMPSVWRDMHSCIDPRWIKCGQVYDSWMVGFLNKRYKCGDFTDRKWVFHPRHGGRVTDGFNSPQWAVGEFSQWAGPPRYWLKDMGLIPKKW